MNPLVLTVFVLCVSAVFGMKIHEQMTEAEKAAMFGPKAREMHNVNYQVLPVHHADASKSKKILQLQAYGRNISLYLEKNNHLLFGSATPIFIAKRKKLGSSVGGVEYARYHYQLPKNFKMYQDKENSAAITAHRDEHGRTLFDGVVMDRKSGENLVIKPIPHRFHEEIQKQYSTPIRYQDNFLKNLYSLSNPSMTPHVVVKEVHEGNPVSFGSLRSNFLDPNINSIFSNSFTSSNVRVSSYNSPQNNPGIASSVRGNQYLNQHPAPGFASSPSRNPQYPNPRSPSTPQPSYVPPKPVVHYYPHGMPNSQRNPGYLSTPSRNPLLQPNAGFSNIPNNLGMPGSLNSGPTNMNTDQMFGSPLNNMNQKPAAWRPTSRDPIIRQPKFGESDYKPVPDSSMSKTWPEIVYPEILVVIDYETYRVHNNNLGELLKYLAAFWNAVDLRYRELSKPKVRLNIAGLIVPGDPDATPYLDKHRLKGAADTIEVDLTLKTMGEYFASLPTSQLVDYDVALAITHRGLGSFEKGHFSNSTAGLAYMRGACKVKEGSGVAIVKDSGGCNGIISAVHELGHALGAPHDGAESMNVPGGPCDWDDGYLMSYTVKDSRAFHWSKCSKTAMQEYLRSVNAKCLRNKPDPGTPYPKPLPGRLLSRDRQCELTIGLEFHATPTHLSNCAILNCTKVTQLRYGNQIVTQSLYMVPNNSPAEGTACGAKSICLDGKCVLDPDLLTGT